MFSMKPAKSGHIESSGYDPDQKIMRVKFKTGKTYDYHGVSPEVYSTSQDAPSFGTYLHNIIRPSSPASLVEEDPDAPKLPPNPDQK